MRLGRIRRNLSDKPGHYWPPGVPLSAQEVDAGVPCRCTGCGGSWTRAELAEEKALRCCPERNMVATGESPQVGRHGWTGEYKDPPAYLAPACPHGVFTAMGWRCVECERPKPKPVTPNKLEDVDGERQLVIDVRHAAAREFLSPAGIRAALRAMGDVVPGHVFETAWVSARFISVTDGSTTRILKTRAYEAPSHRGRW